MNDLSYCSKLQNISFTVFTLLFLQISPFSKFKIQKCLCVKCKVQSIQRPRVAAAADVSSHKNKVRSQNKRCQSAHFDFTLIAAVAN
jgi:hypothetical protein